MQINEFYINECMPDVVLDGKCGGNMSTTLVFLMVILKSWLIKKVYTTQQFFILLEVAQTDEVRC